MTKRGVAKAQDRWEAETRSWALGAARAVLFAICHGEPLPITPYRVGAILESGERLIAEIPAQLWPDRLAAESNTVPVVRPWLITSERILGRLADGRLAEWRWKDVVGCQVDLAHGREVVSLDTWNGALTRWSGPGVAPLAVTAVARLYGPSSLLDHPGLAWLRSATSVRQTP